MIKKESIKIDLANEALQSKLSVKVSGGVAKPRPNK